MRYFILAFVVLANMSCSDKYNLTAQQKADLIIAIDAMYVKDQEPRLMLTETDSIFGLGNNAFGMPVHKKKALLGDKYNAYQYKKDSLWEVIKKNDEVNTQQLIEITKKYGFPNNKRLGVYKAKAYWIFVHSPRVYFDEVRQLIQSEFKAGRLSEYEKEYIFWHLNGRKDMPPRSGKNGEAVW